VRDQHRHDDEQDADECRRDAPAEAVLGAEDRETEGDQPFAQGRMCDEGRVGRERVCVAGVEVLVGFLRPRAP